MYKMWFNLFKKGNMKKLLLILSLFALFLNCSALEIKPNHTGIHKEFQPYVEEFINVSRGLVDQHDFKNITIGFKDLDDSVVGTCFLVPFFKKIEIDRKWWSKKSQFEKEELIFHEFGHCILYRSHTEATDRKGIIGWFEKLFFKWGFLKSKEFLDDGCPSSYMHPHVLSQRCINKHYYYYMDELFGITIENEEIISEEIIIEYLCKTPVIINWTKIWNKHDEKVLKRTKYMCRAKYHSCLKTLIKKKKLLYSAICGE